MTKVCLVTFGRSLSTVCLLLAMVSMGGCGSGSGDSGSSIVPRTGTGPAYETSRYAPIGKGDRWAYSVRRDHAAASSLEFVLVTDTVPRAGATAATVTTYVVGGTAFPSVATFEQRADGIYGIVPEADRWDRITPSAIKLLPDLLRRGAVHMLLDTTGRIDDFDGDRRSDTVRVTSIAEVVDVTTLDTAVGRLSDVVLLRTDTRQTFVASGSGEAFVVQYTIDEWYAPDIGVVRWTETTNDRTSAYAIEQGEIVGYNVGGRRSETRAPILAMSQTVPAATPGRVGTVAEFTIAADEAIDPSPDGAPAVSVVAPDGSSKSFRTVRSADRTLQALVNFTSSGTHRVRIDGLRDLVGNTASTMSWDVVADASAPTIVASAPGAGDRYARTNAPIVVEFSEDVDVASVTRGARLAPDIFGNDHPIVVDAMPRRVTVTPLSPLSANTPYRLWLPGVADAWGNATDGGFSLRFATDPGRIDNYRPFAGSLLGETLAIDDLDGDGRADVLLVGGASETSPRTRNALLHRSSAGGVDAPPLIVPLPVIAGCPSPHVALTDIDGNGRPDVVVMTDCGIATVYNDGPGAFGARQRSLEIPLQAFVGRLADVDGDGRIDALYAHSNYTQVVWLRRREDGGFDAPALLPFGFPMWSPIHVTRIDVNDLDGDGRPDVIVSVSQPSEPRGLYILYQRGDGTFEPPVLVQHQFGESAFDVADLDGDGRRDIVVLGRVGGVLGLMQTAARRFVARVLVDTTAVDGSHIRVADIDRDGRRDLVVAADHVVVHFRQLESGTFVADGLGRSSQVQTLYVRYKDLAIGDVDHDGYPDIVRSAIGIAFNRSRFLAPATGSSIAMPKSIQSTATTRHAGSSHRLIAAVRPRIPAPRR